MEHFVTLFDSLYLPQGLALHRSMERFVEPYTLWILCVDDAVYEVLLGLNLPNVRLLQLSEFETPELLAVKPTRSKGEYCWTLTPFAPGFVFQNARDVRRVTYIDADMWFRDSPREIFKEFENSQKNVLITECAYSAENDQTITAGKFAVQFMVFNAVGSELVRKWWEVKCLEWCYARHEDGKFGDQKYLDEWESKFDDDVYVLRNKNLIVAPWNATRYPYGGACLWHFHGVRVESRKKSLLVSYGAYKLPRVVKKSVYSRYFNDLASVIKLLEEQGHCLGAQRKNWILPQVVFVIKRLFYGVFEYLDGFRQYAKLNKNDSRYFENE